MLIIWMESWNSHMLVLTHINCAIIWYYLYNRWLPYVVHESLHAFNIYLNIYINIHNVGRYSVGVCVSAPHFFSYISSVDLSVCCVNAVCLHFNTFAFRLIPTRFLAIQIRFESNTLWLSFINAHVI